MQNTEEHKMIKWRDKVLPMNSRVSHLACKKYFKCLSFPICFRFSINDFLLTCNMPLTYQRNWLFQKNQLHSTKSALLAHHSLLLFLISIDITSKMAHPAAVSGFLDVHTYLPVKGRLLQVNNMHKNRLTVHADKDNKAWRLEDSARRSLYANDCELVERS